MITLSPAFVRLNVRNWLSKMNQKIIGFHLDEEDHWVADLACGHQQHVRHNPPFVSRPWVLTENGRQSRLGLTLNCLHCDEESEGPLAKG